MTAASPPAGRAAAMIDTLRRLPQRVLQRPTLMLLTFNVAAQLVSVLASPLLTRLYSPEQFGVLGAITAIVMVGVPLATGRYELGLARARSDAEAFALLRVCMAAICVGCAAAAGLSLLAVHAGPPGLSGLLRGCWYVVPLGIACVALYDTLAMEASRQNQLRPLAFSKLSQVLAGVGGQLVFGGVGWTSMGLLVGFLLNQAMGVGRLFRALAGTHPLRAWLAWREVASAASSHRRYPLFAGWTAALDVAARWSLQLAFAVLWDPTIAGFIFLTDRLVGRPLQLLSTSLLPVYVADVSRALREAPGDALPSFHRCLRRQLLLALAWTVLVVAVSPWVIGPVFGARWAAAVPYVQMMTLAIAPLASLHAVAHTLQITGRQRLDAALSLVKLGLIVAAIGGGYAGGLSALATMALFAAAQLASAVLTFVCHRHVLRQLAATPPTPSSDNERRSARP